jgi:hypothetical protein
MTRARLPRRARNTMAILLIVVASPASVLALRAG